MTDQFNDLARQLRSATNPADLFGADQAEAQRRYRRYAAVVHPDHNSGREREAAELFTILQRWYEQARRQHAPLVVETGRRRYVTDGPPIPGDLADLYPASAGGERVLLKIARDPRADDLFQAEREAIATLDAALAGQAVRAHFPTLLEHARIRDAAGTARHVHVLAAAPGVVSLAEVLSAYPGGLHPADAAWMFNRMLAALGLAHQQGIVHGAVLPAHLLLQPADHNGVLIDWCYSVPAGQPIRAISPPQRDSYPPEVLAKQPATPATDLYMAARCMLRLLGGAGDAASLPATVPAPLRALLAACLIAAPARRADDAWQLLDDFRAVLADLYGPPRFRPFAMPPSFSDHTY